MEFIYYFLDLPKVLVQWWFISSLTYLRFWRSFITSLTYLKSWSFITSLTYLKYWSFNTSLTYLKSWRSFITSLTYLKSWRSFITSLTLLKSWSFNTSLTYIKPWCSGNLFLPWPTWGLGGTFSLGSFPSPPRPYSGITLSLLIPAYLEIQSLIRKNTPQPTSINQSTFFLNPSNQSFLCF